MSDEPLGQLGHAHGVYCDDCDDRYVDVVEKELDRDDVEAIGMLLDDEYELDGVEV
jgi:hypothetical protein